MPTYVYRILPPPDGVKSPAENAEQRNRRTPF